MSERARLAADISSATDHWNLPILGSDAELIAVELEEKGYRKPRTITTAEELASIRPGTIAVDLDGNAWKRGTGSWVSTGGDTPALYDDMDITLTVIHEPTA